MSLLTSRQSIAAREEGTLDGQGLTLAHSTSPSSFHHPLQADITYADEGAIGPGDPFVSRPQRLFSQDDCIQAQARQ